jgi:hypothetical protein
MNKQIIISENIRCPREHMLALDLYHKLCHGEWYEYNHKYHFFDAGDTLTIGFNDGSGNVYCYNEDYVVCMVDEDKIILYESDEEDGENVYEKQRQDGTVVTPFDKMNSDSVEPSIPPSYFGLSVTEQLEKVNEKHREGASQGWQ